MEGKGLQLPECERCSLWDSRRCHRRPTWSAASRTTRSLMEQGVREWLHFDVAGGDRSVIYWVTPKAAHTSIMHLLRRPPFRLSGITNLSKALALKPFEFTFVREPLQLLISAAGQLHHCLMLTQPGVSLLGSGHVLANADDVKLMLDLFFRDDLQGSFGLGPFRNTSQLGKLKNFSLWRLKSWATGMRNCARDHLRPQVSGYNFDRQQGVARLHFVGRVERLREDWQAMLNELSVASGPVRIPNKNSRKATLPSGLRPSGVEWRRLESDATVRHHLAWDWQCFDASFFARNACSVSRSSACTAHASYKEYQLKTQDTFKSQGEGQAKALKEISVQIEALETQGEEQAKALKDALKAQGEEQANALKAQGEEQTKEALNDILSAQTS